MCRLSDTQTKRLGERVIPHALCALDDPSFAAANEAWAQEWLGMSFAEAERLPMSAIGDKVNRWLETILGVDQPQPACVCAVMAQK